MNTETKPIVHEGLIQSCIQKDRQAQNALYHGFAPVMFTVCLRYAKNRHEAEEILQEGFIKVFTHLHQFRNDGSLEGWIRRIMVTTALQRIRGKSPLHVLLPVEHASDEAADDEQIESNLQAKELIALVQSLPTVYRSVFNLYVFEGYRHREIGELLGISENTSKSNLYDARQLLKEKLASRQPTAKKKCL